MTSNYICNRCHKDINRASVRLKCVICLGHTHVECVSGRYSELEVTMLKRTDTPLHYICYLCMPRLSKDSSNVPSFSHDAMSSEAQSFAEEVDRLKKDKTRNQQQLIQMDERIQDLQKKVNVYENASKDTQPPKRQRMDSDSNPITIDALSDILVKQAEVFARNIEVSLINAFAKNAESLEKMLGASLANFALHIELQQAAKFQSLDDNQKDILVKIQEITDSIQVIRQTPNVNLQSAKSPSTSQAKSSAVVPQVNKIALSFAQVLASSPISADAIRNVNIKEGQDCDTITQTLRQEKIATNKPIVSIKAKGKCGLTFTCATPEDANAVEEALLAKYNEVLEIKKVVNKRPQIKIVKIVTDEQMPEVILREICGNNPFMQNRKIDLVDSYTITNARGTYRNIVISCDLDLHNQILQKGSVIYGFSEYKCHENINVVQCVRCQRYGHFNRECVFDLACRLCAQAHETKDCDASDNLCCSNCVRANAGGATFNTAHKAADDRCPRRQERINSLKAFLLAKNDQ